MYVCLCLFGRLWSAVVAQHAVPNERSAAVLIPASRRDRKTIEQLVVLRYVCVIGISVIVCQTTLCLALLCIRIACSALLFHLDNSLIVTISER